MYVLFDIGDVDFIVLDDFFKDDIGDNDFIVLDDFFKDDKLLVDGFFIFCEELFSIDLVFGILTLKDFKEEGVL